MRQIKFRAWNKEYKEMFIPTDISFNEDGQHTFTGLRPSSLGYLQYDVVELMQFTGLKDKNNKEIYEGDIVEWICIGGEEGNIEDIGRKSNMGNYEVIFEDGKFIIKKPPIPIGHINKNIEVIGNIYESTELKSHKCTNTNGGEQNGRKSKRN